ncbi:MAG: hypothetical protein SGCHY_005085, partial [Lobulomycetales sp.]
MRVTCWILAASLLSVLATRTSESTVEASQSGVHLATISNPASSKEYCVTGLNCRFPRFEAIVNDRYGFLKGVQIEEPVREYNGGVDRQYINRLTTVRDVWNEWISSGRYVSFPTAGSSKLSRRYRVQKTLAMKIGKLVESGKSLEEAIDILEQMRNSRDRRKRNISSLVSDLKRGEAGLDVPNFNFDLSGRELSSFASDSNYRSQKSVATSPMFSQGISIPRHVSFESDSKVASEIERIRRLRNNGGASLSDYFFTDERSPIDRDLNSGSVHGTYRLVSQDLSGTVDSDDKVLQADQSMQSDNQAQVGKKRALSMQSNNQAQVGKKRALSMQSVTQAQVGKKR